MTSVKIILLIVACVLEVFAAIGVPLERRLNLIAAGLAFWLASIILPL